MIGKTKERDVCQEIAGPRFFRAGCGRAGSTLLRTSCITSSTVLGRRYQYETHVCQTCRIGNTRWLCWYFSQCEEVVSQGVTAVYRLRSVLEQRPPSGRRERCLRPYCDCHWRYQLYVDRRDGSIHEIQQEIDKRHSRSLRR